MANKFNYTTEVVNIHGQRITLRWNSGVVSAYPSGRTFPCTLPLFRGIARENGGQVVKSLNPLQA